MNPRSGGGKVARFQLQQKAEALGAEVALLDQPDTDVAAARPRRPRRGADLLGVAGGDGTQALVAQVAAEHDVPFLVISAGTRNHFALDLGLDRDDPSRCLDALRDGVEARIDLGEINGRPFVNNASFGAYAEIVRQPGLPRRQARHHPGRAARPADAAGAVPTWWPTRTGRSSTGRRRCWSATTPTRPPTSPGWAAAPGSTAASLGVIAVRVDTARQAAGLLHGAHRRGLLQTQAREVRGPLRRTGGPGRHRRGVRAPVHPGALHGPARCAAGPAAPRAARRATTAGRTGLGAALALAAGRPATADTLTGRDPVGPLPSGASSQH